MRRKLLLVVLTFCLGSFGSVASAGSDSVPGVTDKSIKLGHIGILTGPIAMFGQQVLTAQKLAIDDVNNRGGIYGRQVELAVEDSGYSPDKGIMAGKLLVEKHKVLAFSNIVGSSVTVALFPTIRQHKIPCLPGTSTSSLLSTPFKRYVFGLFPTVFDEAVIFVDYIRQNAPEKNPRLAIIVHEDEFGFDAVRGLEEACRHYNLNLVAKESFKKGSYDFSSQILNLRRAKPDYVLIVTWDAAVAAILKEAYKQGYKPKFFSESFGVSKKTLELAGKAAEGLMGVMFLSVEGENVPGMVKLTNQVRVSAPEIKWFSTPFVCSYVATLVSVEGLKLAGPALDREKLIYGMEKIRSMDLGGLMAPVSYGPDRRQGARACRIVKADLQGNRWIPITGWQEPSIQVGRK